MMITCLIVFSTSTQLVSMNVGRFPRCSVLEYRCLKFCGVTDTNHVQLYVCDLPRLCVWWRCAATVSWPYGWVFGFARSWQWKWVQVSCQLFWLPKFNKHLLLKKNPGRYRPKTWPSGNCKTYCCTFIICLQNIDQRTWKRKGVCVSNALMPQSQSKDLFLFSSCLLTLSL